MMFRRCFESLACAVPIKLVALRHTVHGQLWGKNDWLFSYPRIDTAKDE